ncbi:MAG: HAMP domain-containing protein [Candidatus Omnitrophica bacterium]|nr:HAMP domain-containing protein [Candidatus Omnitrophota bacterium]
MSLHWNSIRVRLIAWYVMSLGLVHLIVGATLYQMIASRLHHEFDRRLETYTACLVEVLPQHRQLDLAEVVKEMSEVAALGSNLFVRVTDAQGRLIYESPATASPMAARLRVGVPGGSSQPSTLHVPGAGPWRMLRREVLQDGRLAYVGLVAIPLQGVHQALDHLRFILIVVVPCVLLLASFGAWLVLNRALTPLKEVIQTAQAIQANDCSQRLRVPTTGDEVQALAETFNAMLERLHRSFAQMRRFISDASHELRTPLAVLKGEVELELKSHPASEDRCQETLATCAHEISRMSRLVETLLFLSHAEAEKIALELKPIRLDRVIGAMAEEARILAEAKRLQIDVVNDSRLVVRADEMRLKQLLLNLLDNAIKYTPAGGRIIVGCRADHGQAALTVTDTGIGIAARHLPRIFDRFYRVDSARSRADGSYGLGLSICQWIAEAHGGSIEVDSLPGQGSTFRVRLPALKDDAALIEANESQPLAA